MIGQALEHFHQSAALLAGADHVHVEIGKNLRLLGHCVGKAAPFHHFLLQIATDG